MRWADGCYLRNVVVHGQTCRKQALLAREGSHARPRASEHNGTGKQINDAKATNDKSGTVADCRCCQPSRHRDELPEVLPGSTPQSVGVRVQS